MWYLIFARDAPGSLSRRIAARPEHLARLQGLHALGRLKIAGPIPAIDNPDPGEAGFLGSMLVVEFESLESARAWADADPYVSAGVYQSIEIHPFKPVLP
jgi:uncharacterized protein YciI